MMYKPLHYSLSEGHKGYSRRFTDNRPPRHPEKKRRTITRNQPWPSGKGLVMDTVDISIKENKRKNYGLLNDVSYLAEEKPDYIYKGKYLDLFCDFGAKKIFGDKKLLKAFFAHLLKDVNITELYYTPSEALGQTKEDRSAIFDLSCRNKKGDRFLLEMQRKRQRYFIDRSYYYSTFAIQAQAFKGPWNYQFNRVYSIGILNFNLDKKELCLQNVGDIKKKVVQKVICGKLTFIYLQLRKFKKKEDELESGLDKWLYAIKNMHRLKKRPEALFEEEFKRLFELTKVANLTPREMEKFRTSLKARKDQENIDKANILKGEKRGKKIGIKEEKRQIAKKLKENGVSIELIEASTGLSREQILQL